MEEERKRTVEYIRGVRVEGSSVITDRNNAFGWFREASPLSGTFEDRTLMLEGRSPAVFEIPTSVLTRNAKLQDDDLTHYVDVSGISGKTREMIWKRLLATKNTAAAVRQ
ncbi:MAG: hypothetical protein R3C19_07345 [Planctomycetaceae bacterium]